MSKKTLLTVLTSGLIVWGAACPAVAATPEPLPAQTPPAKFKKATTVTSGRRYLFVVNLGGQYNVATAAADNSTYSYLYVGEPAAVDADGTLHIADPSYAFTLTATTDGYTIQDCHGRYLIQQLEEYDYFGLSDKPEAGSTWAVKAENDGTFTLTNTQLGKTIGYDRYYSSFGAYAQKSTPAPSSTKKSRRNKPTAHIRQQPSRAIAAGGRASGVAPLRLQAVQIGVYSSHPQHRGRWPGVRGGVPMFAGD